jgi:hypothetical protein
LLQVQGLSGAEWGVSFAIGFGAYPVSLLTRFLTRNVKWESLGLTDLRHVHKRAAR